MSFLEKILPRKMMPMKRTDSVLIDGFAVDRTGKPVEGRRLNHFAAVAVAGIAVATKLSVCHSVGCDEGVTVAVPEVAVSAENNTILKSI